MKKKDKKRPRHERRFVPRGAANPWLVRGLGVLSALVLGAGAYGFLYAQSFAEDDKLRGLPSWLVAGGALVLGLMIWFGSSSDAAVRVGDPGIALEKGEVRRMPWWGVSKIRFTSGALTVDGKDESGAPWKFPVSLRTQPDAAAWIAKEALARIPKRVAISDEELEGFPGATEDAGEVLALEPLQVVGRKDAISGKPISYEPDARVCLRCERVYFAASVPRKCKCGAAMAGATSDLVSEGSVSAAESAVGVGEHAVDEKAET